jgi:hypothetical protein
MYPECKALLSSPNCRAGSGFDSKAVAFKRKATLTKSLRLLTDVHKVWPQHDSADMDQDAAAVAQHERRAVDLQKGAEATAAGAGSRQRPVSCMHLHCMDNM